MPVDVSNPYSQIVLVSAFLTQINSRVDRNVDKYIEYGKKWIALPFPKVVFLEPTVVLEYFPDISGGFCNVCIDDPALEKQLNVFVDVKTQTVFVQFEGANMYFHKYKRRITRFHLNTPNPKKDTLEYMFVQCFKTEWMRMAVQLCETQFAKTWLPSSCSTNNIQYIWNDFGIYHMFEKHHAEDKDALFRESYLQLETRCSRRFVDACSSGYPFQSVYFAGCWEPQLAIPIDVYTTICWVFAGSVFGGFRDGIIELADKMKRKCIWLMCEKGVLVWEINVWYMLYQDTPRLFEFYRCDHTPAIIHKY